MKIKFLVLLMVLMVPAFVYAQDDAALLKYRQDIMKSNGQRMGMIGHILKNKLPFNDQVAFHAWVIQKNNLLLENAFKKKIIKGRTDSTPAVWSKWMEFSNSAKKSAMAAENLAKAAQSGNVSEFASFIKPLGRSCGGCHKVFRKPKAERFIR